MKHVTFGDKSLILGDEAADTALEYAAELAHHGDADTVELRAISGDGDEVLATFLLGGGSPMMAETAHSSQSEPDNTDAVARMRAQINRLQHVSTGRALTADEAAHGNDDNYASHNY